MGTLASLAREHLPAEVADRYISLLRPAFGLGADAEGPVVGQLGGLPDLPDDVGWPALTGDGLMNGPLSFIASIDLARLPGGMLDISLPSSGMLYFFYYDGHVLNSEGWMEEESYGPGGAPVLYVPEGRPLSERAAPSALTPLLRKDLRAELIDTDPDHTHPVFSELGRFPFWHHILEDYPEFGMITHKAKYEARRRFKHQLGGYSVPVQQSPECYVKAADQDRRLADDSTLLAQFNALYIDFKPGTHHEHMGDLTFYWLIRPSHLTAVDFGSTWFDYQCT